MRKILISSAKGGVGKTTITVNLAKYLSKRGYRVGIIDADISAPNIPIHFGFEDKKPMVVEDYKIIPYEKEGVKIVSYWFELPKGVPMLLFGTDRARIILKSFCKEVKWGNIDVLIVDCPPAVSDEIIGLIQYMGHIDGVIVVVQGSSRASIEDAKLAMNTFDYHNIPIIGYIKNMVSEFFDNNVDVDKELNIPKIGEISLSKEIKEDEIKAVVDKLVEVGLLPRIQKSSKTLKPRKIKTVTTTKKQMKRIEDKDSKNKK